MDKDDKQNTTRISKGFFAFLCIFAALGIVALLGGAVLLGIRIGSRQQTVTTPQIAKREEINDVILKDAEAKEDESTQKEISTLFEEIVVEETPAPAEPIVLDDGYVFRDDVPPSEDDILNIVYFGDSIFDFHRDDGTSVPQLTSEMLGAQYINLAMGGTCASIDTSNKWDNENWDSTSGAGMAKAAAGLVNPEVFLDCAAKDLVINHKDHFCRTDVFVIEYGINDYLSNRPIDDITNLNNPTTYQGGLQHMISACRHVAPDATIVICKPTYCEFWAPDGQFAGDYYVCPNKIGKNVFDYMGKVDNVDDPDKDIWAFEPNKEEGINIYNNAEYLEDGIHLTEAGRRRYAEMLSDYIFKIRS